MAAVINSLYMSAVQQMCVPFKILMWTLLACERRLNILLLRCVYLLHEALVNIQIHEYIIHSAKLLTLLRQDQ